MLARIWHAAIRIVIAAAILWLIATVPLPTQDWQLVVFIRVPLVIFIFIVFVGKTLYDTFFFERQP